MRRSRAPPRLAERLVVGAAVVLDDIARPGERDVFAGWEASSDWRLALDERASVAIGRHRRDTRATTLDPATPRRPWRNGNARAGRRI